MTAFHTGTRLSLPFPFDHSVGWFDGLDPTSNTTIDVCDWTVALIPLTFSPWLLWLNVSLPFLTFLFSLWVDSEESPTHISEDIIADDSRSTISFPSFHLHAHTRLPRPI